MSLRRSGTWLVIAAASLVSTPTLAWSLDRVAGVITRTYVMVEDTELSGDITCQVTGDPCLAFGAHGIQLKLNGFTITGLGDATTGCGGVTNAREAGISTNGFSGVMVRGPGLIQRFRMHGVNVIGSTGARVEGVSVSTNCGAGIIVAGNSFGTLVQENVAVRNGASAPGLPCGGI